MSEIERDGAKAIDKEAICDAFMKTFAEMGKYSDDIVPLNNHKLEHCSEIFDFKVLTIKKIYKAIDSWEINNSAGPKFVHTWIL